MLQVPLIPFVPAAGAVVIGLIGSRWFGRRVVAVVACATLVIALALSVWSLVAISAGSTEPRVHDVVLGDWIPAIPLETAAGIEMFTVRWTLRLDPLSAVMSTLVASLGLLIHLYATASMREEPRVGYARFFSYLNLFCAFMLMLVLSGNFLVLFVGWQGMTLCSFLLIAFWFGNRDAANGAMKAFVVNWLGDWGLLVAIFLTYFTFGTLDFREVAASVTSLPVEAGTFGAVSGICLGLWIAAVAKSAQIPLHVWLPGALEGPAPVAALIQTTTMVTAGVFIIARNGALLERAPVVMTIATTLGVLTAFMAGALALVQDDIRRVLVYLTISQLGLVFIALGAGAFAPAVFHLVTLAVSLSLLILGSSTIVQSLDGEAMMPRMGGLRHYLPATFVTMMVGAMAVTGIPPLSGFFSGNEIAAGIFAGHRILWVVTWPATVLTAVCVFRLMCLTFYGSYRGPSRVWPDSSSREAPTPLLATLMALAVVTIVLGFIGLSAPGSVSSIGHLLAPALVASPRAAVSTWAILVILVISTLLPVAGILLARQLNKRDPGMSLHLSARWPDGDALLANQYYFDELYAGTFVSGVFALARALARFDRVVVAGCANACGWTVQIAAWMAHMFDKHVLDRIAEACVSGFRTLGFRFRFPVSGSWLSLSSLSGRLRVRAKHQEPKT